MTQAQKLGLDDGVKDLLEFLLHNEDEDNQDS